MKLNIVQRFNFYLLGRNIDRVLVGRLRDRRDFKKGRFTRQEAKSIFEITKEVTKEIGQDFPVPACKSKGAFLNVSLGLGSLALYRAILLKVKEIDYSTELATDICWDSFERSTRFYRFIIKVCFRDSQKQINMGMKMALKYPFSRPDYDWKIIPSKDALFVDFYTCPVHEYFKKFGDEEMAYFRKNWCTQDFSIGNLLAKGGQYERTQTLSDGDAVCNMKFSVR